MSTPLLPTLDFTDCATRSDVEARIKSWTAIVFGYRKIFALTHLLCTAALHGESVIDDRLEDTIFFNDSIEADTLTGLTALCEMLPPSTRPQ